jgi:hypothetical protein
VAVADEQHSGPGRAGHASRLLKSAQVARGQVRAAAGVHRCDGLLHGRLVRQRPSGHDDLDAGVERDDAEVVGRVESVDETDESRLRALEALTGHGAAAVEHDLQRRRLAGRGRDGLGAVSSTSRVISSDCSTATRSKSRKVDRCMSGSRW